MKWSIPPLERLPRNQGTLQSHHRFLLDPSFFPLNYFYHHFQSWNIKIILDKKMIPHSIAFLHNRVPPNHVRVPFSWVKRDISLPLCFFFIKAHCLKMRSNPLWGKKDNRFQTKRNCFQTNLLTSRNKMMILNNSLNV